MDSPRANDVKAHIIVCPRCEHQMPNVAGAMRRQESQMVTALQSSKNQT